MINSGNQDNSSNTDQSKEIGSTTNGDESVDVNDDNSQEPDVTSSTGREVSDGNQKNSLNNDVGAY